MVATAAVAASPDEPWAFFNPLVAGAMEIPVGTEVLADVVAAGARSQPIASTTLRSLAVTALTTPELENASNESLATDEAQSPVSPPATVLNAPRLVVPPSAEK